MGPTATSRTHAGFTWSDIRAALAAIAFIITNSARVDIDPTVLNAELQQLGLPKENSDGISRPYRIHRERLRAQAAVDSLRLPRLLSLDWAVDAVVSTSNLGTVRATVASSSASSSSGSGSGAAAASGTTGNGVGEPVVHLRLGVSHEASQRPRRVPFGSADATPLLLTHAATASASSGPDAEAAQDGGATASASRKSAAAFGSLADKAASDAALLALGVKPLRTSAGAETSALAAAARTAESTNGSLFGSAGKAASNSAAGSAAAANPAVKPSRLVDVALSQTAAAALLAELRISRAVLSALVTATVGMSTNTDGTKA